MTPPKSSFEGWEVRWYDGFKKRVHVAVAFIVISGIYEFGTYLGLVAYVATDFWDDPYMKGGGWPIISLGLALSRGIQIYYLVNACLGLIGSILWYTVFDTYEFHVNEYLFGARRGKWGLAFWAWRAFFQTIQMVFLIALGSIPVTVYSLAHNVMGGLAAVGYIIFELLSIPYHAQLLSEYHHRSPNATTCVPARDEAGLWVILVIRVFTLIAFIVFTTTFMETVAPKYTNSILEYFMYGVFPVQRMYRGFDILLWERIQYERKYKGH